MSRAAAAGTADAPWQGFWMGGYEGADHVNAAGMPLDMAHASGHLDRLDEDHRRAAQAGLSCVRESIGWRLCEAPGGAIDLSRALAIERSARRHGLQVLWTLMHYGLPADLSLHDDALIPRLARFAAEVARVIGRDDVRPPVFTPVNEIGFLAWAASQPAFFHPPNHWPAAEATRAGEYGQDSRISGYQVKRRLARAALAAMAAMRQEQPRARFLHVEPVVHVVAPRDRPELAAEAEQVAQWQWQAWDLLCGRVEPQLGGAPEWLDLVGVNHYHSSQWELDTEARLDWAARDPRRRPFRELLAQAWQRYGRVLMVAETSHVGQGRAAWMHEMLGEVRHARRAGVPVQGLCIYPLVDRPDWQQPQAWHHSGLWDVDARAPGVTGRPLSRRVEPELRRALHDWQQVLGAGPLPEPPGAVLLAFSSQRWQGLRRRNRHLLERLARAGHWRVVFVEEPLAAPDARLECIVAGPHVELLVPHLPLPPGDAPGFDGAPRELLQGLLQQWLGAQGIVRPLVWLSTPLAAPLALALSPSRLVYDCHDELADFAGAPATLSAHEAEALARADLVLAAGEALAGARRAQAGARLRLLRSGVDARLFGPADPARPQGWAEEEAAQLSARLPGAQLGYAGAIDERLDLPLLDALAQACPQWQFVMAGPVLRIDPSRLPRRPNLHWLGPLPYAVLPSLLSHWQLALLPFVDNAATRHAQTLTLLQALAAGLAVAATELPDLLAWQGAGVHCVPAAPAGTRPQRFAQAIAQALDAPAGQRRAQRALARRRLRSRSWEAAARQLDQLLQELQSGSGP